MALIDIQILLPSSSESVAAELDLGESLEGGRLRQAQPEAVPDVGVLDEGRRDLAK